MNPIKDGKPVRRSTELKARAKLLAWAMLDVGHGKGNMVTISINQLQAETGQARNTVRSGLDELLAAGWFSLVRRGQANRESSVYEWHGAQLPLFANRVNPEPCHGVKGEPGQGAPNGVNMRAQRGQTGVPIKNKRRTRTKNGAARLQKRKKENEKPPAELPLEPTWTRDKAKPPAEPALTIYAMAVAAENYTNQIFPASWGRDGKAINPRLADLGRAEIMRRWQNFLESRDENTFSQQNRGIPYFASQIESYGGRPGKARGRIPAQPGKYAAIEEAARARGRGEAPAST